MKHQVESDRNDSKDFSAELVTSGTVSVEQVQNAQPLGQRLGLSFSWRCLQLFNEGHDTHHIAKIMEAERVKRPGKNTVITEARVYNAMSKARDSIYERGLTFPRVKVGEVKSKRSEA